MLEIKNTVAEMKYALTDSLDTTKGTTGELEDRPTGTLLTEMWRGKAWEKTNTGYKCNTQNPRHNIQELWDSCRRQQRRRIPEGERRRNI